VGRTDDRTGEQAPGAGARVVVVDDDDLNRALVRTMFARSAEPLLRTAQLIEAPDLARARAVLADGPVDLVLLDLRLPDGSGITLAAELKERGGKDRPVVVALTGATESRLRQAAVDAGCAAVLLKPYPIEDLSELLVAHLRRRAARSGSSSERPFHRSSN
jgi:CheY-like chemotaxis protein